MKRKRINRNLSFMILLLCITIGYAYLNSELKINGTTGIVGNTWDVHFENVVPSQSNTATVNTAPVANPQDKVTNLTYNITFNRPGDVYEFNVDVVNAGSIDAMIELITSTIKIGNGEEQELTSATLPTYIDYYVKYSDGVNIRSNHLLPKETRETIEIHVEYKMDITEEELAESSGKNIEFNYGLKYAQANDSAIEKPVRLNCTYNGDLVNNATYTNDQYSYTYNSTTDGWSASLIDRNSTDPVTSPLCSTINGKPINNMSGMFASSKTTSIDTSSFDTSKVTNMSGMFYNVKFESIDVSSFNTENVTNMSGMFDGCSELTELDLSSFNTSKVSNIQNFLNYTSKLTNINFSNWDFAKLGTSPSSLLYGNESIIKSLDFSNAKFGSNMSGYFSGLSNLETIVFDNVDTSRVTNMSSLFGGDEKIKNLDLSSFDTSNVTNMTGVFSSMPALENLNVSGWDFSKVDCRFRDYIFHTSLKRLDVSNVIFGTDMSDAFDNLTNLEYLNLNGVDTSRTTNMYAAFYHVNLRTINISDFDMHNVKTVYAMFAYSSIERLDLSSMDSSSIETIGQLCMDCYNLTYLNLNNFGSDSLNSIADMLYSSPNVEEIHMKNFNFGTVSTLGTTQSPFHNKRKLKTVDLSGSKMSNIKNADFAFNNCEELESIDFSNVYAPRSILNLNRMFYYNKKLNSLDLSSFDLSQVTAAGDMFYGVPATTVYVKTQADVDVLNAKANKPDTMTFVVKP